MKIKVNNEASSDQRLAAAIADTFGLELYRVPDHYEFRTLTGELVLKSHYGMNAALHELCIGLLQSKSPDPK